MGVVVEGEWQRRTVASRRRPCCWRRRLCVLVVVRELVAPQMGDEVSLETRCGGGSVGDEGHLPLLLAMREDGDDALGGTGRCGVSK